MDRKGNGTRKSLESKGMGLLKKSADILVKNRDQNIKRETQLTQKNLSRIYQ
jgi:hypothetical protein